MVVKEQSVLNAANLSLWMVNVSQAMLVISGEESVLDLKAHHHGLRYAQEVFKILPENTKYSNAKGDNPSVIPRAIEAIFSYMQSLARS